MKRFIMLIGLPGSGKSTYAKELIGDSTNVAIVSSDDIRKQLFGDECFQGNPDEVFKKMLDDTIKYLNEDFSVIYDATNISNKKRRNLLEHLNKFKDLSKEAHIIATPYDVCLKRNKEREMSGGRGVPEYVIKRMLTSFTVPTFAEGFNTIKTILIDENHNKKPSDEAALYFIRGFVEGLKYVPHDNPHHEQTIGNHMLSAYENLITDDPCASLALRISTLAHDIGKSVTKEFKNSNGEPSEIAHFYGHQNAGAYMILTMPFESITLQLDVALRIQLHMNPFLSWGKSNKSLIRDANYFGSDVINDVMRIHKYDLMAH